MNGSPKLFIAMRSIQALTMMFKAENERRNKELLEELYVAWRQKNQRQEKRQTKRMADIALFVFGLVGVIYISICASRI